MPHSPPRKWNATKQQELIIEVWEHLDCESVGAKEIEAIQQVLREQLGEGGVQSPAAIARTLADEGAVLRHPEIFEYDFKWRVEQNGVLEGEWNFSTLNDAADTISRMETARRRYHQHNDEARVRRTRELALRFKQEMQMLAGSALLEKQKRTEAREIAQWLTVWLQEPELFDDWLSLRRRSPEFLRLIGE